MEHNKALAVVGSEWRELVVHNAAERATCLRRRGEACKVIVVAEAIFPCQVAAVERGVLEPPAGCRVLVWLREGEAYHVVGKLATESAERTDRRILRSHD